MVDQVSVERNPPTDDGPLTETLKPLWKLVSYKLLYTYYC